MMTKNGVDFKQTSGTKGKVMLTIALLVNLIKEASEAGQEKCLPSNQLFLDKNSA